MVDGLICPYQPSKTRSQFGLVALKAYRLCILILCYDYNNYMELLTEKGIDIKHITADFFSDSFGWFYLRNYNYCK